MERPRRIVVLGGLGGFGQAVRRCLSRWNIAAESASRRPGADLEIDAEDRASMRRNLRSGDVVVDAAGPFQARSTALLRVAVEVGFDVVDLNDALLYAEEVALLAPRLAEAGVRVLTSCSSVSAISVAVVRQSGVLRPARVTTFLAPASRHTARRATARTLLRSVGRPIRVWRQGRFTEVRGWGESRPFATPAPLRSIRGYVFESADSLWLPQVWPSLLTAEMFVDSNTLGFNGLLRMAGRVPFLRPLLTRGVGVGVILARWLGSAVGALGYEIEDEAGEVQRFFVTSATDGALTAVVPTALAVRGLCQGISYAPGLVAPDRQFDNAELIQEMNALGIGIETTGR